MSKQFFNYILLLAFTMFLTQCSDRKGNNEMDANSPLLQKWSGPYNGVPAFDKIKTADFKSALQAGMNANREEIDRIVANKEAPTFKNTIEELEKTGFTLRRVLSVYGIWKSSLGSPELDSIQEEMEPRLTAFNDSIIQNADLFKKIESVYNDPSTKNLNMEQQRLVERYYK